MYVIVHAQRLAVRHQHEAAAEAHARAVAALEVVGHEEGLAAGAVLHRIICCYIISYNTIYIYIHTYTYNRILQAWQKELRTIPIA